MVAPLNKYTQSLFGSIIEQIVDYRIVRQGRAA